MKGGFSIDAPLRLARDSVLNSLGLDPWLDLRAPKLIPRDTARQLSIRIFDDLFKGRVHPDVRAVIRKDSEEITLRHLLIEVL